MSALAGIELLLGLFDIMLLPDQYCAVAAFPFLFVVACESRVGVIRIEHC